MTETGGRTGWSHSPPHALRRIVPPALQPTLRGTMGFMDHMRSFDAYPKTLEDFRVRTFSGAAVSLCAGVLMLVSGRVD